MCPWQSTSPCLDAQLPLPPKCRAPNTPGRRLGCGCTSGLLHLLLRRWGRARCHLLFRAGATGPGWRRLVRCSSCIPIPLLLVLLPPVLLFLLLPFVLINRRPPHRRRRGLLLLLRRGRLLLLLRWRRRWLSILGLWGRRWRGTRLLLGTWRGCCWRTLCCRRLALLLLGRRRGHRCVLCRRLLLLLPGRRRRRGSRLDMLLSSWGRRALFGLRWWHGTLPACCLCPAGWAGSCRRLLLAASRRRLPASDGLARDVGWSTCDICRR